MTGLCTCLPRSPDDQCPSHGYEEWLKSKEAPVSTEGLPMLTPKNGKAKKELLANKGRYFFEEEWLSECCGAPPHEATPDIGEDNPAGICGQCREHCGFEKEEPA